MASRKEKQLHAGLCIFGVLLLMQCASIPFRKAPCVGTTIFKQAVDSVYNQMTGNSSWLIKSVSSEDGVTNKYIKTFSKNHSVTIVFKVDSNCTILSSTVDLGEIY